MTTFVLIHGAYQGGWIWKPVAERLRAAGHTVHVPTLDGCSERAAQMRAGITTESQALEVAEFLRFEDLRDVVLVGTSSGGMVTARVAETASDRIARLVFVDALALMPGEKIRDIVKAPPEAPDAISRGPTREAIYEDLARSMPADLAGWAADRFGQHAMAVFTRPIELDGFWQQPWNAAVIWCRQAKNPGEAHQRRCAATLKARWHELDTGHYPMLSAPDDLTRLIVEG